MSKLKKQLLEIKYLSNTCKKCKNTIYVARRRHFREDYKFYCGFCSIYYTHKDFPELKLTSHSAYDILCIMSRAYVQLDDPNNKSNSTKYRIMGRGDGSHYELFSTDETNSEVRNSREVIKFSDDKRKWFYLTAD